MIPLTVIKTGVKIALLVIAKKAGEELAKRGVDDLKTKSGSR